jgi:acetyl esterase/lipase
LDYALSTGAIIVAPDYSLLPEVSGKEILEDVDNFWHWLHSPQIFEMIKSASDSRITPDLDRVLVVGESAGKSFVAESTMAMANKRPN